MTALLTPTDHPAGTVTQMTTGHPDRRLYGEAMRAAFEVAQRSPDPSTQNGGVLLDTLGRYTGCGDCNRFPNGVAMTDERLERPLKYSFIEHAERNTIYAAARIGIATRHATLVCPWAACADCARAIAQAGISTLVRLSFNDGAASRWRESVAVGDSIMLEAGVRIIELDPAGLALPALRRNGELWLPGEPLAD